MKRIKKIKRRVAALVMSFFLTLGLYTPAFLIEAKAEAVEVLSGSSTVADIILTMYAGAGGVVTNNKWINDLYNSFGSSFGTIAELVDSGYLVNQGGKWVDAGLSQAIEALPAYSDLGIDEAFSLSALETGAAAVGGGAVISTITGTLATTGVLGCAVGAGIGLGILANHLIDQFGKGVYFGSQITNKDIINKVPDGAQSMIYFWRQHSSGSARSGYMLYSNYESITVVVHDGNQIWFGIIAKNANANIKSYEISGNSFITSSTRTGINNYSMTFTGHYDKAVSIPTYERTGDGNTIFRELATQYRNGSLDTNDRVKSPDIIGSAGNLQGGYDADNQKYTVPNLKPSIDVDENDLKPLTKEQWLEHANQANTNTNEGNYPDNSSVFDNLIDSIKALPIADPVPDPEPEPDPDPNPNPDPETVPLPDVNPYPDTYPVADPDTVPVNKEQPEYTEKATENETDISEGDPYTTPDLLDKFPFCIPRDILRAFKKLDSGSREAPHIQWRFHPNEMIDYTFDVDFSTWDSVAVILRTLELIAFIILLGIATRNLILS